MFRTREQLTDLVHVLSVQMPQWLQKQRKNLRKKVQNEPNLENLIKLVGSEQLTSELLWAWDVMHNPRHKHDVDYLWDRMAPDIMKTHKLGIFDFENKYGLVDHYCTMMNAHDWSGSYD